MFLMSILDSRLSSLLLMSPLQLSLSASLHCFHYSMCLLMCTQTGGASFMSQEMREYLTSKGVATSRTTSYNPTWTGQVETYNGTVWRSFTMSLIQRIFRQSSGNSSYQMCCTRSVPFCVLQLTKLRTFHELFTPFVHRQFNSFLVS